MKTHLTTSGSVALAQVTSLFIPGFDPQPLSAVPLGVDTEGRTTYEIKPGAQTDTSEDVPPPFTGMLFFFALMTK